MFLKPKGKLSMDDSENNSKITPTGAPAIDPAVLTSGLSFSSYSKPAPPKASRLSCVSV